MPLNPPPVPVTEPDEATLLASDRAYAKAKDDGSLDRWSYESAMRDQLRHSLGDKS
jgi:hypothetical protein